MQIKTKIVSCHTADSKPVKQEVNSTVILPPLVLSPALAYCERRRKKRFMRLMIPRFFSSRPEVAEGCTGNGGCTSSTGRPAGRKEYLFLNLKLIIFFIFCCCFLTDNHNKHCSVSGEWLFFKFSSLMLGAFADVS